MIIDEQSRSSFVVEKARKMTNIKPETPCAFSADADDRRRAGLSNTVSGPAVGIDEDVSMEIIGTTATPEVLKFWPWVNRVRFTLLLFSCVLCRA